MENFNLENFPTSECARKMLGYVSDGFYDESYVGKWLFQVMGAEYDKALGMVSDLFLQFFPETATWGLMYHEIKWGLPVRENLSCEERRRLIYQKRDLHAPMAPYRMEKYLADATGFEVHVADINDPGKYGFEPLHSNVFKVYFLGEATLDARLVFGILNRIKQSHTVYTVNDRTEIVLDNRNLERIALENIQFQLSFYFWNVRYLDGTWLLDGTARLDGLTCPMHVGIRYGAYRVQIKETAVIKITAGIKELIDETVTAPVLSFITSTKTQENMQESICISAQVPLDDGEKIEAEAVIKKNLWYLDGSCRLDGSRQLNAEIKKEEL